MVLGHKRMLGRLGRMSVRVVACGKACGKAWGNGDEGGLGREGGYRGVNE